MTPDVFPVHPEDRDAIAHDWASIHADFRMALEKIAREVGIPEENIPRLVDEVMAFTEQRERQREETS